MKIPFPDVTEPCEIRHRSTAAVRKCPGYHPGIDPESADRTPQEAAPPSGDPHPRSAIWKSVLGATGGFGCERATFYRETVRTPDGWRLDEGADEPVLFGIALDVAHGTLMRQRIEHGPADASLIGWDTSEEGIGEPVTMDGLWDDAARAVRAGVAKARGRPTKRPMSDDDWRALAESVGLAVEKALGLWPNRTREQTKAEREAGTYTALPEPEGTPEGPPIGWLDQPSGTIIEAQRKLYAPDVAGGRGLSGQPDYVFVRDRVIIGWLDVKALSRAGTYPAKWTSGEAVAYDLLCASENGGALPEWHGYLEYRRVAKPYWALITAPVDTEAPALARAYLDRWGYALDHQTPDGLSFSPARCGACMFRQRLPDVDFGGCPIGRSVLAIAPPPAIEGTPDGY